MTRRARAAANVLIVEDESIIALDIRRLLLGCGYSVTGVASTAEEALQAIEREAPDVVLMDIHLKGKQDGIETALTIRRRFRLPVIFVTAHADEATLDRARLSEPFGYIVKPIPALSLTGTIEMALHKHHIEQKLEAHRAWLSTVLRSIPEAVFVTDLAGQLQFLNGVAAELSGYSPEEAEARAIDEILPLESGEEKNLASKLIDRAEWGNKTPLPKETFLRAQHGAKIPVEGEVVISYSDEEPAGAVITLRNISQREQEERILRQEERIFALGHLASGISRDFQGLHQLVINTANGLTSIAETLGESAKNAVLEKTDILFRAGAMGSLMTGQLALLNVSPAAGPAFVSASGMLASLEPLFQKLCGPNLTLKLSLTETSTLVLCHPDRLQMVLLNLFMNASERLGGQGSISVATRRLIEDKVSIVFDLENGAARGQTFVAPGLNNPDFSLSIGQAIVSAMEGSLSYSNNEGRLHLEIQLPLQQLSQDMAAALARKGTVLLIGSDLQTMSEAENRLEAHHYGVLRCSSAAEALLLGQFHDGKIDAVIADGENVSPANRRRLFDFFGRRNKVTKFILLQERLLAEAGWISSARTPRNKLTEDMLAKLTNEERTLSASI